MINVTAAIMERNGKIFIAKRSSNSRLPNKWEFPGGKVEVGETPEQCLRRELKEEFDIEVTIGDFVGSNIYPRVRSTRCTGNRRFRALF